MLLAIDFTNLHEILQALYQDMMPLCEKLTGVAKGIAGLGALFYVAAKVWQALARAEPIDVYPLLRPFAIGLCILFFPTFVIGTINTVLSPVVKGCHGMLESQTFDMNRYREQKETLEREAFRRDPEKAYLASKEDFDKKLDELGWSPKDLKTIHFMNKMMDAGVRVFKLEGRARGPEYVRLVTECYKEAVKAYCEGTFDEEKIAVWDERLRRVFNRGFWDGYYLGQRLGEWSSKYGSGATRKKVYVARGIKYFSGIGVAEFEMESGSLRVGDEILVTGPTTGAVMQTVDEIRVDLKPVEETVKGERFSIKMSEKIRPSDRLYKMEKVQIEKELR